MKDERFPPAPLYKEESKEEEKPHTHLSRVKRSKGRKKVVFVIPTLEEVKGYLNELGETRFTAERFLNHYGANGWHLSNGNEMSDWKCAVNCWIDKENKFQERKDERKKKQTPAPAADPDSAPRTAELQPMERFDAWLLEAVPGDVSEGVAGNGQSNVEVAEALGRQCDPDNVFDYCKGRTDEQLIRSVSVRLNRLAAQLGEPFMTRFVARHLFAMCQTHGLPLGGRTCPRLVELARYILTEAGTLTISQFMLMMHHWRAPRKGQPYERPDLNRLEEWVQRFLNKNQKVCSQH